MDQLIPMLILGLVTSLHCIFMCGGLVLTCAVRGEQEGPWHVRLVPHLAYQGAKLASYAGVAVVLGTVVALAGGVGSLAGVRTLLLVAGGAYMVLLGLSMTGRFTALRALTPRPPKALVAALSRNRRRAKAEEEAGRRSLVTPIVLGALTGFMPCAPLIAAQTAAAASGSPFTAAALMLAFGLGTAPLMLAFGLGSSLISGALQRRLQIVSAIAVILFGIVILDRGLMLLSSPVTLSTITASFSGARAPSAETSFAVGTDGVVEIPLAIRNVRFEPQSVVIPAGRPVRLVVDRQEDVACSDQLQIPSAGLLADLAPNGVTMVDVPPLTPGTYTLTCGMAMMSGSIVAVEEDAE